MIPRTLEDWDLSTVEEFVLNQVYETEYFDFKSDIPNRKNKDEKEGLVKDCCAFANSSGGFLIFGIVDNRELPVKDRIQGINSKIDFPEHFGVYPSKVNPNIYWNFKNPPIKLDNGNHIHIVHIPQSLNVPHCFDISSGGKQFLKRTNKGNEEMSYQEIQSSFLGFHEKTSKLRLLVHELFLISYTAESLIVKTTEMSSAVPSGHLDLSMLETIFSEVFSILTERIEVTTRIATLRLLCKQVNQRLSFLYSTIVMPIGDHSKLLQETNQYFHGECPQIISTANELKDLLTEILLDT